MKSVLIIEDSDSVRENIAEILEMANYKVFTAENGKAGIERVLQEKPDLIVCDISMPVLDGYGVLHLLHKNPGTRNIPLIFLTARTERSEMRKGMDLGADDYITKPFEESELLNAIESRLKKADFVKEELSSLINLSSFISAGSGWNIVQLLTENRDTTKYRKKQRVYSEGNRPSRLFYIQKGKIKAYKTNEDGKELIVDIYSEGDFFGYVALLEGAGYRETTEALEDSELIIIPKADFDELLDTNHKAARKISVMLAEKVIEKENQLVGLAYNSLRQKVAEALLAARRKYNDSIIISRSNLASIAGTATESLIRTLSDFRDEHLIDIKEGIIIILNEKKLAKLVG